MKLSLQSSAHTANNVYAVKTGNRRKRCRSSNMTATQVCRTGGTKARMTAKGFTQVILSLLPLLAASQWRSNRAVAQLICRSDNSWVCRWAEEYRRRPSWARQRRLTKEPWLSGDEQCVSYCTPNFKDPCGQIQVFWFRRVVSAMP